MTATYQFKIAASSTCTPSSVSGGSAKSHGEMATASASVEVENNVVNSTKKEATSVNSNSNIGPQLLLCSIAGASAAVGITLCRWLMVETGEVLLLFANGDSAATADADGACYSDAEILSVDGIDSDFSFFQCDEREKTTPAITIVGEALRSAATSPHLRSAPLIILFVSSTVFLVGIVKCWSYIQTCQEYGEEISQKVMAVVGVSNSEELMAKLNEKQIQWKDALQKQLTNTMNCMDGMVLDDILHKWIQDGIELSMGACGGMVLYSLPEEMFAHSVYGSAKDTRRRLIRAADPTLEHVLFRPGGVWDALPPSLRHSVRGGLTNEVVSEGETETASVGSMERPQNDDDTNDSSDTPLASSPVPSVDVGDSIENLAPVHYAQVISEEGGLYKNSDNDGSKETVAEALSATINDLVVSNFMGATGITGSDQNKSGSGDEINTHKKGGSQQLINHGKKIEQGGPYPLPKPLFQLEKVLHHSAMAASLLFLCHLRGSPSTRRAWGSAAKILTSLGLLSTAVGAGTASAVLRSNDGSLQAFASNSIVGMLYSKMLDGLKGSQITSSCDIGDRIQGILKRLREEICKNKRLQASFAFLVLFGMKKASLSRKRELRSPYSSYQRAGIR